MSRTAWALAALLAAGCGAGTDGKPVTPSTTPAPTPVSEPEPEPEPEPRACADERQLALQWEQNPLLAPEWNPERPFRVWVEEEAIQSGGARIGNPNYLEEQVVEPLRVVADRIEEQLGYPIFDPSDLLPSRGSQEPFIKGRFLDDLLPGDNPWHPACAPATHPPISAGASTASIFFNDHVFNPAITCGGFVQIRAGKTIVYELAYLLGMKHAASSGDASSRQQGGIHMSESLTSHIFFSPDDILPEDIDSLGCVFPHPDFPR